MNELFETKYSFFEVTWRTSKRSKDLLKIKAELGIPFSIMAKSHFWYMPEFLMDYYLKFLLNYVWQVWTLPPSEALNNAIS